MGQRWVDRRVAWWEVRKGPFRLESEPNRRQKGTLTRSASAAEALPLRSSHSGCSISSLVPGCTLSGSNQSNRAALFRVAQSDTGSRPLGNLSGSGSHVPVSGHCLSPGISRRFVFSWPARTCTPSASPLKLAAHCSGKPIAIDSPQSSNMMR